jgi:IS5 family transposase
MLALVTIMQFAEGLSDRDAANAVRTRIDCKYLLGLELSDPGFDYSILSRFRARLVEGNAEMSLLQRLLDQLYRVLENRHHAESEQINFDEAESRAVVFVPLDDNSTRHRRRLKGHNRIQLPLADDHAARMLTEMARQVLHSLAQVLTSIRQQRNDYGSLARGGPTTSANLSDCTDRDSPFKSSI